eukprot:TRINITY_DN728_c0_g1_i6.p2 TRINITY_DN728_c0_g1~~TRINITY_DN728_c0_g1_i6.p2  ORF type:complete len:388 (+),score=97.58 TRINITY_DN728_c0_g1_i6:46-1209(+)
MCIRDRITPEEVHDEIFITQPGSSIATSLSIGESKPKHVGILDIRKNQFKLNPVALETVRPFVIDDVSLEDAEIDSSNEEAVVTFLRAKVDEMIRLAMAGVGPRTPKEPLIRLRVDYTGFKSVNPQRFGQAYVGKVANPSTILLFRRKRNFAPRAKGLTDEQLLLVATRPEPLDDTNMEDLVTSFLGVDDQLEILPEHEFNLALKNYVEKEENGAFEEFVRTTLVTTQSELLKDESTADAESIATRVNELTKAKREKFQSQDGGSSVPSVKPVADIAAAPPPKKKAKAKKTPKAKPTKKTKTPVTTRPRTRKKAPTKNVVKKEPKFQSLDITVVENKNKRKRSDESQNGSPAKKKKKKAVDVAATVFGAPSSQNVRHLLLLFCKAHC